MTFFTDDESGHGGAMILWDSVEAIEDYVKGFTGIMRVATAGLLVGSPRSLVAEVIEPD